MSLLARSLPVALCLSLPFVRRYLSINHIRDSRAFYQAVKLWCTLQIDDSKTIRIFSINCLNNNYDVHALFIILQEQIEDVWRQRFTSTVCTCVCALFVEHRGAVAESSSRTVEALRGSREADLGERAKKIYWKGVIQHWVLRGLWSQQHFLLCNHRR